MNRKYILPLITLGIASMAILGATGVQAQTPTPSKNNLTQKLAQKFSLKESYVQAVFNEEKTAHRAEMHQREEERLAALVNDGKITEAQKQLIINKINKLKGSKEADHQKMRDMSAADMKKVIQDKHAELEKWAKDNGIDPQYLPMKGGHGKLRQMKGYR